MPEIRERDVKTRLLARCEMLGITARKVTWDGVTGAPDWMLLFPHGWRPGRGPGVVFVELKAPGEPCTHRQLEEHAILRAAGQIVRVVDSLEAVEELLR